MNELSNSHIIDFNTQTISHSRKQIAGILYSINTELLNPRQQKELAFYLKDYNKELVTSTNFNKRIDLLSYIDSSFSFTVNPILGGNYLINNKGAASHWWNGAEAWAGIGKFGFWGSLRDNHESEFLSQPDFMNQNYGGANFKTYGNGQVDYWESRGGVTYDFGIGSIGLIKDHFVWGSNYNGSAILSGRTPSVPRLNFEIKPVNWFEFKYIHAWLNSQVVDSARSFYVTNAYGTSFREVYHGKYIAANLFTFKPFKNFYISFGNSIIYDYDNAKAAYFIPVMFFKALDHQLSSGINNMNSQMFIDLSARPFKYFHFYSSLFVDEVAVKRITDPDNHNFYSFKIGSHISNLIPNAYAGFEYTISNALIFRHNVPTLTFESNLFNLGHYLEDNAKEIFLQLGYRPGRNMDIKLSWNHAEKGPDHTLLGSLPRQSIEPFTPTVWTSDKLTLNFNWQIINDIYLRIGYSFQNVEGEESYLDMWTPEFEQGKTGTLNFGINVGW
ncbi:MAG: hypothetical protein K9H49_03105 [Bacteroidales bacterium]|nr:hypothetical protein [Bacteroidales bacterium]MCF8389608.1 hypothetical protein [Bacteroidales bacterium]